MKTDHSRPVEVFEGSSIDAGMVQSLLEAENIEAFVNNDYMGSIAPWWIESGGVRPVKVVVPEADVEKSLQIISDLKLQSITQTD